MRIYTYNKLNTHNNEIRLIKLMPGKFEDDIHISIFHAPLLAPVRKHARQRMSLKEIQETLPPGWLVQNTFQNRYIFIRLGNNTDPENSWLHPDPNFDHSLYELSEEDQSTEYLTKYEALSYTWGDQNDPVKGYVQDSEQSNHESTTINLGKNLASALKHLRLLEWPRVLWVDALCINQKDMLERNIQVTRMKDIYNFASVVVVWLGEAADDSDLALSTIQYLDRQVEVTSQMLFGDAPGAQEPQWWDPTYKLPYDNRTWSSLLALFRRAWFDRVWVLQEVQLGGNRTIAQCGSSSITWKALRNATFILCDKHERPLELGPILDDRAPGMNQVGSQNFSRILQTVRRRQCRDPRDRIYGVLSLASQSIMNGIQPGYDLPEHKVFKDAALVELQATDRLEMLK